MKKYILVQDIVNRLTESPAFRTFYTLYLMAETDVEKQRISENFIRTAKEMKEGDFQSFRIEFSNCTKKLPLLAQQLLDKVDAPATLA